MTATETKNTDERERTEKGKKKKRGASPHGRTAFIPSVLRHTLTPLDLGRTGLGWAGQGLCTWCVCARAHDNSPPSPITSIFPNYLTNDGHKRSRVKHYPFNNISTPRYPTLFCSFYVVQIPTYLLRGHKKPIPSIQNNPSPPPPKNLHFIDTSDQIFPVQVHGLSTYLPTYLPPYLPTCLPTYLPITRHRCVEDVYSNPKLP